MIFNVDLGGGLEDTRPMIMEGTRPLTGPALPNLINAVRMLKSKSKQMWF